MMDGGRDERARRIRVGLTGLAAVLVIVASVAAILDGAREDESVIVTQNASVEDVPQAEPLAEIGVVPPSEAAGNTQLDLRADPPPVIEPTPATPPIGSPN